MVRLYSNDQLIWYLSHRSFFFFNSVQLTFAWIYNYFLVYGGVEAIFGRVMIGILKFNFFLGGNMWSVFL